ncbi:tetratricopeptide repeat protein [Stigmatella sp. ncwal1]|uniref:Tetratricopeptide repeat protein n=1 Tax=Stigmatella ashevillensis TaxID=2995309 RepID=A0ABT5D449_9BACT|nr:tetratricopeptide repeat protein [Stigmatella ashevillena]MDC0708447.1 tetratricopeptide repeat protein [Stigmatella ashevillena]
MLKRPFMLWRLIAAVPLCTLAACATGSATQAELASLRAEIRALREQQARVSEKVERMERSASVLSARPASPKAPVETPASAAGAPAPRTHEVPSLTVVKLKPKAEPAPALPVQVDVAEPDSDQMEMFVSSAPDEAPASSPMNTALLDAEFEQAVSALRTGNVETGVVRLQAFAEQNPRHAHADNALYFSGLGLIGLKDLDGASRLFERLISNYPAGDAVLDGMLRLAECRLKLKQPEDARALYTRVITQFPGTAAATQAEQRLASLSP